MEGNVRSGGVLKKKKSSSGDLIIKKKVENRNSGGWEDLSDASKEKKRPRLVANDLGVSDDDDSFDFMRRKSNDKRLYNGGIDIRSERKRSKLDLLDFDEFYGKRMRDEFVDDRFKMVGRRHDENLREFGVGPSHRNVVVNKRHCSYFDGCSSGRSKRFELEEDEAEEWATNMG